MSLNDAKSAVDEAKKILADNPKDFTALYYTMLFTQGLHAQNQSPTYWIRARRRRKPSWQVSTCLRPM